MENKINSLILDDTIKLRQKLNGNRKVYFKDILPSKRMVEKIFSTYTSEYIDLSKFKNKLYSDPIYSEELPQAISSFTVLNGDWLIDEEIDDYGCPIIKFTDNKSGQYIKIGFKDHIEKLKFLNDVYTTKPVKQEYSGMDISKIINKNTLYQKKDFVKKIGIISIITGLSIFTYLKKKK